MKSTVAIGLKAIGESEYQRFKISSKPFSCWWIKEHKKGDLISSTLLCLSSSNQRIDYVTLWKEKLLGMEECCSLGKMTIEKWPLD